MKNLSTLLLALLTVVAVTGPASAVPSFIGGTIINAPQAEGCCGGGSLFNFNGGVGDITGIVNTTQVGLDNRSGGDGVYNGQTNVAATFFITAPAGQGQLTGFQVMNSTNGQFDDRQTGQFQIDVSTNGGLTFTNSVVNTVLNIAANTGADDAAPQAQQFNIAPITLNSTASQNIIRITSQQAASQSGAGVSLSEFRSIVNDGAFLALPPVGQWNSFTFKRVGAAVINNLADADNAINAGVLQGSGLVNSVNYADPGNPGGGGNFGGSFSPLGLPAGDNSDFTVLSTGFLQISTAGNYQFRNNTDDGSRLRIDLNGDGVFGAGETVILDDVLSGDHNADSAVINLLPGQYMIEHTWFERGGGAQGDLGVAFNGGAFQLFGNPRNDGALAFAASGAFVTANKIIPEPASLTMIGLAALSMGMRRRRVA